MAVRTGAIRYGWDVFPRRAGNGKVPTLGDLWRVTVRTERDGKMVVRVDERIPLRPTRLVRTGLARPDTITIGPPRTH